jgi:TPR repeat protein
MTTDCKSVSARVILYPLSIKYINSLNKAKMSPTHYDVFLSRKSQDAHLAKELYDFLTKKGVKVFDSEHSLPELGNADYQKAIDHALDSCTHMIVVGSSVENITSSWVEAEWRLFINEKRSGYKTGNILSVIATGVAFRSLPASLRYFEAIYLEKTNFERIWAYVKPTPQQDEKDSLPTIVEQSKDKSVEGKPFSKDDNAPTESQIEEWTQKGREYYSSENYTEAVKWYRKAAEQGNANAQYNLGMMYDNGSGVEKNKVEAVKWYRKAAEQGYANAQYNLGVMYECGSGVEENEIEALKWYRKAAEQGNVYHQYNLGVMYTNGSGVEKNEIEAVKWYRKAAEQGYADAQQALKSRNQTW